MIAVRAFIGRCAGSRFPQAGQLFASTATGAPHAIQVVSAIASAR